MKVYNIFHLTGPILLWINGGGNQNQYIDCATVNSDTPCTDRPPTITSTTPPTDNRILVASYWNNFIYMCQYDTIDCYKTDTTTSPLKWNKISGPSSSIFSFYSTVVANKILFFSDKKIHILDPKTDTFSYVSVVFSNMEYATYASKDTVTYGFGFQDCYCEIWKNTNPSQMSTWQKVGDYRTVLDNSVALWYGDDIYVTGGYFRSMRRDHAFILNTKTDVVTDIRSLPQGRSNHRMAVIDNKPAILGGRLNSGITDTIYTYDKQSNSWTEHSAKLLDRTHSYALVQLPPN